MSVIVAAEPILAGAAAHHDHRPRTVPGEQPLLRDSAPPADDSARADDGRRPRHEEPASQAPPPEPEPELPPGAMFAAAVVAGALPPVPRTREELILRIGSGWAAPEGGTRLRDLIA